MGQPESGEGTSEPSADQNALRKVFVGNVERKIFVDLLGRTLYSEWLYGTLSSAVARETHSPWQPNKRLGEYVGDDYEKCLAALVACHQVLAQFRHASYTQQFDKAVLDLIKECCEGLHLRWESGKFVS